MYDIYQWEAHGNNQYVDDATLAQKIEYYKDYQKKFDMSMPALIDDDNQSWAKLYETYCPEDNKKREYTAIYAIDFEGIVAFKSAWISPGVWSNQGKKPYPMLDEALEELLATAIDFSKMKIINDQKAFCFFRNNTVFMELGDLVHYSLGVFDLKGKCLVSDGGIGNSVYTLDNRLSSGSYIIRIVTGKNTFMSTIPISK